MAPRVPTDGPSGPQSQRGVSGASTPQPNTTVSPSSSQQPAPWRAPEGAWFPRPQNSWFTDTSTPTGVANASDFNSPQYNATFPASQLAGALNADETNTGLFQIVAAGRGHNATANGVLQAYVAESARLATQGQRVTPQQLAYQEAVENGWIRDGQVTISGSGPGGGGSSGGGGGYSGPSYSYSQINEATLEDLANQIGMTMVGRGVTDAELAKILKRVRKVEARNPQVTSSNGAGVSTTQQGVTDSDRQDVIENILARNPQYGDYQKATTMMDWFGNALNARLQNV